MARYKASGDEFIIAGDTTSDVIKLEDVDALTDIGGTPISFEVESHDLEFGSRARLKEIAGHVYVFGKDLVDTKILVQRNTGDFKEIGTAQKDVNDIKVQEILRAHYLRFRVSGASSTVRGVFRGIELPKVLMGGYGE